MFHFFDLIWAAIVLVVVILCLVAVKKAPQVPAKVISGVLGIVFIVSVPAMYWVRGAGSKHDYVTSFGTLVRQGKFNKCEQVDVEKWSSELAQSFLNLKYRDQIVKAAFKDVLTVCLDTEKLSVLDRYVRGYSTTNMIVVGYNGDKKYTESLFKHEAAHHILVTDGVTWNEEEHHRIMKTVGL